MQLTTLDIELLFDKIRPEATLPQVKTTGSLCFDITAAHIKEAYEPASGHFIRAYTGLKLSSIAKTKGYHILIFDRSSNFVKRGIQLANSVGIIDSDYEGEIILQFNYADRWFTDFSLEGAPIAQGMVFVPSVVVTNNSGAIRGDGGFGSTDNNNNNEDTK